MSVETMLKCVGGNWPEKLKKRKPKTKKQINKKNKLEINKQIFQYETPYLFLVPDEFLMSMRVEGNAELEAAPLFVEGAPRWVTLRRLALGRGSVSVVFLDLINPILIMFFRF